MQYILTEKEYQEFLKDRRDAEELERELIEVQSKLVEANNNLLKVSNKAKKSAKELYDARLAQQQPQVIEDKCKSIVSAMNARCKRIGVSTNTPSELLTEFKRLNFKKRTDAYAHIARDTGMKVNDVSALIRMKERLQGVRK
jgi:DNA-binding phage protein